MPPSVGSVETTNSGFRPISLTRYCQHRPSQSSSCTVPVIDQGVVPGQAQILDDLAGIDHRGHAAFLVAGAAPADGLVVLVAFVGVELPVVAVADAHRVDMGVQRDHARARTDGADDVAHRVDLDRVEADFLHLFLDALDLRAFLAAFAGKADHVAQEAGHVGLVLLGQFADFDERNGGGHDGVVSVCQRVSDGCLPNHTMSP